MSSLTKIWKVGVKFAQVSNICIEDPKVSALAKAIYTYMAGRPEGWIIRSSDIEKKFKECKDTIYKGINELIDNKYIHRLNEYKQGRKGMVGVHYIVSYKPTDKDELKNQLYDLIPEFPEAKKLIEIIKDSEKDSSQVPENTKKDLVPVDLEPNLLDNYNNQFRRTNRNVPKGTSVRPKGRSNKRTIRLNIKTELPKTKTKNGLLFDSKDPKKRKKGNGVDLSKWLDFELNIGADYERPIIDLQTHLYAKKVKPAQAEVKEVLSYWNKVATEMSNNGHSLSRHEISESKVIYMFQLIVTGILHSTEFTVEDIKKAIDNYAWILNNSPWYNTIYTFPRFFGNKNLFENCITDNVKDNKSYVNRGGKAKKLTGEMLVDEIKRFHRRKHGSEDSFMEYWNGYYKLLVESGEIQSVEDFHKFH